MIEIRHQYGVTKLPWGSTGIIPVAAGNGVADVGATVHVTDTGYVWLEPSDRVRNVVVYVPEGGAYRYLEVSKAETGGLKLKAHLHNGDEVLLALNRSGEAAAKFRVEYTQDGVRLIADNGRYVDVKVGEQLDIGRDLLEKLGYGVVDVVSSKHARIIVDRDLNGRPAAFVTDIGSTNGTAVRSAHGKMYILYAGRADNKAPVLGVPPKRYGIYAPDLDNAIMFIDGVQYKIASLAYLAPNSSDAPRLVGSSHGYVTIEAKGPIELKILEPSGVKYMVIYRPDIVHKYPETFYRRAAVRDMPTGGRGLELELKNGDWVGLVVGKDGGALVELRAEYTHDGLKLCADNGKCLEAKVGEEVVIGRREIAELKVLPKNMLKYISEDHIRIKVTRESDGRVVARVSDAGSANGSAVYAQSGASYILYTGYSDRGPTAGLPPKSYGIRTGYEVLVKTDSGVYRFPEAVARVPQRAAAVAI